MDDLNLLQVEAEKIRSSGILGKTRLIRLFDFLVDSTAAGTIPKEAVIAAEVFQKTPAFDVSQDSIVRVYVHNLRRKLDQFYATQGRNEPLRLALPKGEYRLVMVPLEVPPAEEKSARVGNRPGLWVAGVAVGLAVLGWLAAGLEFRNRPNDPWENVRNGPIWSRLLNNDKPIVVVLGDYYIFGDTDESLDVKRLVREFSINSKDDLAQFVQTNPTFASRYLDVGLGYLPTSSASALANIVPVLAYGRKRRVRVVMMSSLDPGTLKSANVVYIGLLSGLGKLQKIVFAGSRFQIGDSYDELVDQKSQHHYISGANPYAGESKHFSSGFGYHDYGFFSTFSGLAGNQIVVVAAMQDEGLRQLTEALTDRSQLDELYARAARKADFEALYEVLGMDSLNLNEKLLVTSPLNTSAIWTVQ